MGEEVGKNAVERLGVLGLAPAVGDRKPSNAPVARPWDPKPHGDWDQLPPELRIWHSERVEHSHRDGEVLVERLPARHEPSMRNESARVGNAMQHKVELWDVAAAWRGG